MKSHSFDTQASDSDNESGAHAPGRSLTHWTERLLVPCRPQELSHVLQLLIHQPHNSPKTHGRVVAGPGGWQSKIGSGSQLTTRRCTPASQPNGNDAAEAEPGDD